jgi:hypothetical protein
LLPEEIRAAMTAHARKAYTLQVHMIVDNYGHPHPPGRQSVAGQASPLPPALHSSWLNLVERWFGDLTGKMIRRGVFGSVNELIDAIIEYLKVHNDEPKPFVWTATAESILERVRRGRVTLQKVSSQN